jgi:rhamnulose-1-phosphate aldolase
MKAFDKIVAETAEIAGYLWEKGWAERNAGNISVNVTGLFPEKEIAFLKRSPPEKLPFAVRPSLEGQVFMVTCKDSRMRDLARDPLSHLCFVYIQKGQKGYIRQSARNRQPTSELPTHLAIHDFLLVSQPENKVVLHTHALELVAMTQNPQFKSALAINRLLWGMHPETAMFVPRGTGFVPFMLPGTEKIARATLKELRKHSVVIWEKHGVLAVGHTIADAFDSIDILARSARIWFTCRNAGFNPEGLSPEQQTKIRKK